jgi:hypothetical protein
MARHALCVGINDYPGTGSDLSGCVNDANDWRVALASRGFAAERLLNREATGKAIRGRIGAILGTAEAGDLVVVTYSGHGSFVPDRNGDEPDGTDECWCPYDITRNGPVTDDELFTIYSRRRPGVKLVVISDSCHSGSVSRFAPIRTPPTTTARRAPQRKVRFLPPMAFLSRRDVVSLGARRAVRRSSPPGRYAALLLSGCQDTEYSFDAWFRGRPNGAFTFVALKALKSLSARATYQNWHEAIRRDLPSQQYPQSPNLFGSTDMKRWGVLR